MKIILGFVLLVLFGCVSNTVIVKSWRDPNTTIIQGYFKNVLVVALLKNDNIRKIVEDRVVTFMPNNFHTSYDVVFPENFNLPNEEIAGIIKDDDYDGIITMDLVDIEREEYSFNNKKNQNNFSNFHAWFGSHYSSFRSSSFYESNKYYIVETCVFSVKQNKLIWYGTTKSIDDDDIPATVDGILNTLYKEMKFDGFYKTK